MLERWISQGAKWGDHWSLAPLVDPIPTRTKRSDGWARQSLDNVVLAGLNQVDLAPSAPAAPEEWLRRVALFNDSQDADLDSDFPTLTVPVDHEQAQSAIEKQRHYEASRVARNDSARDLAQQVAWQPLTPVSAQSSGGQLKIEGDHVRRAGGTFPVGVQYTVDTAAVAITALRIDIFPESNDSAKWPEQGSVLSYLELKFVDPQGNTQPIELADVFVDGLTGPDDPRSSLKKGDATAIGGYPKLHGPR